MTELKEATELGKQIYYETSQNSVGGSYWL